MKTRTCQRSIFQLTLIFKKRKIKKYDIKNRSIAKLIQANV